MIEPNFTYKATILNIVDGDTVDVEIDLGFRTKQTHRLRLNRCNTYETRGTRGKTRELAFAGKDFTAEKVSGKEVIIITKKSDAFGRYLADVIYEENGEQKNLSDELLSKGLAVPYKKKSYKKKK